MQRLKRATRFVAEGAKAPYADAKARGSPLWRPRPKMHALIELLEYNAPWSGISPACTRCYQDGDNMRRAARVGGTCHMHSINEVALHKVLAHLALRWSSN